MNTLGIDVSLYQGDVDWTTVAAHEFKPGAFVRYSIARASIGLGTDARFAKNAAGAMDAGLLSGAYHAFMPHRDSLAQAKLFFRTAAHLTNIPPVIDFETTKGVPSVDALRGAIALVLETERLWQRPCVVYTYPGFWQAIGNPAAPELAGRDLWIAHYGVTKPAVPRPWANRGPVMWQFDGDGGMRLPGGTDCDFNWFYGDETAMRAWAGLPVPSMGEDTMPASPQAFLDRTPRGADANRSLTLGESGMIRAGEGDDT